MSEETKKTAPAAEAEQQPAAAPEATAEQAAPAQEPAAEEAADPKDDKKKDGGWFNKKAREMEAVKAKLDAAEQNAAQAKEQLLRMAAEYDNYRKRSTREADQKFNDGISFAVNQIIPILDTLDMAAIPLCGPVRFCYRRGHRSGGEAAGRPYLVARRARRRLESD